GPCKGYGLRRAAARSWAQAGLPNMPPPSARPRAPCSTRQGATAWKANPGRDGVTARLAPSLDLTSRRKQRFAPAGMPIFAGSRTSRGCHARSTSYLSANTVPRMDAPFDRPSREMFGGLTRGLGGILVACAAAALALVWAPGASMAAERVDTFDATGLLFKDKVEVIAVDDPSVAGVTLFVSDFKRSIANKLSKDFFDEPSQAGITCSRTGHVQILDPKGVATPGGQEVFSESKGLSLFGSKATRVRRLWDADRRTLLYVAYGTRGLTSGTDEGGPSPGRYKTSICAVEVPAEEAVSS
ncbi:unnamed protein product, partial [Ostreobium quekettii]